MQISYENERGKIVFGKNADFKLLAVSGLGLPEREYTFVRYIGEPGQTLTDQQDLARTITVNADLLKRGAVQQELARVMQILYEPGDLKVSCGNRQRKIRCRCSALEDPVYHGRDIANVTMQFTCDRPYFTDYNPVVQPLFQRVELLGDTFTLPCVFTQRTNGMSVVNMGAVNAEPVLHIYQKVPGEAAPLSQEQATEAVTDAESNDGVLIQNHTTGQQLELDYQTDPGEHVVIDIANRTVMSETTGENLLPYLSKDSFLSDFWLAPGANELEVTLLNEEVDLAVSVEYENQYIEAVG